MERGNLPGDLIEEILSRVPAKPLARFRSISKQWNALLISRSFAKKHSANAPKEEESLIIMLKDLRVNLMSVDFPEIHSNIDPSVKLAAQLYFKDPFFASSQVDIHYVFHCDGLLLCTTLDSRLVVWNPWSGETKWIKPKNKLKKTGCYALGYDNKSSCKQYKVLRVDCNDRVPTDYSAYEIYDFTSESWRTLCTSSDWFLWPLGISVKGNTYWIASTTSHAWLSPFLLSFDFSTERLQRQFLPHPVFYENVALSVVREDKLCVCYSDLYSADLDVWVRTTRGSSMSWSKFLTVKSDPEKNINEYFDGCSFLADEQNKVVVCCGKYMIQNDVLFHIVGENKHIQNVVAAPSSKATLLRLQSIHHGGVSTIEPYRPLLLNYFPSLAQIQQ